MARDGAARMILVASPFSCGGHGRGARCERRGRKPEVYQSYRKKRTPHLSPSGFVFAQAITPGGPAQDEAKTRSSMNRSFFAASLIATTAGWVSLRSIDMA